MLGPSCLRLVIVDDNPRTRSALTAFFSTLEDMQVVGEAADGRQAIELLPCCSPDVVLMDARMPHMDGIEATRLVKERWPRIPVVILTLYADCQAQAQSASADAVLLKGCSLQSMASTIRGVAGR
jgi:DNA-binding NarL/FixJ family response regulator